MPYPDSPSTIRLLHLSDAHFRAKTAWDARPVLAELCKMLRREVKEQGFAPDLVVFTGDLAFSGKAEEYQLAYAWLREQLWPALSPDSSHPLPVDRLLIVPGNHDADRGLIKRAAHRIQRELLEERDQQLITEVFEDDEDRDVLLRRHQAYLEFHARWLGNQQPAKWPWWQRQIQIRGVRLHVAGLDSAWMACGEDRGKLLLGRYQLNQCLHADDTEDVDWRLALMHHPWEFLAEIDFHDARQSIHQHRDLLLRGHLHATQIERIVPPAVGRSCMELGAGALYENSQYPNAYQWIELVTEPERQVRVLPRIWSRGEWVADLRYPGLADGVATYDLNADATTAPSASVSLIDTRRYLEALWDETARIDIRGLATSRPEAHSFAIEELYIELDADGSPLRGALGYRHLAISGDPGCGKTTFLRWIGHCLTGDLLGRDPGAASNRLGLRLGENRLAPTPILVSIAEWLQYIGEARARGEGPALEITADWLPCFLGERATRDSQGLDADAFRRVFETGEAMILLDGLDEAPDRLGREQAVALIERVARAWPECPIVVTSRPAAMQGKAVLPGFEQVAIEALDAQAIDGFLRRWSQALFPDSAKGAEAHRRALSEALASRREIRLMARNTVMLTALAVVHWNEKRLPEQRAELYEAIIKWLLEAREKRPGRATPQRCRRLLQQLALDMLDDPAGRQVQVPRRWAAERLAGSFTGSDPIDQAEAFLADEEIDSGIIVRRGKQLRFWHLTFLEYLAAQALAGERDADREDLLTQPGEDGSPARLYRPEWREPLLLLAGVLAEQGLAKVDGLVSAVLEALGDQPDLPDQARAAGVLGAVVRDLSPFAYQPADGRYRQTLDAAMAVFCPKQAPSIALRDRIAAADALALSGDPRLEWTHPERWVSLSGGEFLMGAQSTDKSKPSFDPGANENEAPVHRVHLSPYRIARFPITVAEYARFLEDEGHAERRWWTAGGRDKGAEPDGWDGQLGHPSRPVVDLSWYQGMAFCAWLTHRLAWVRGADGKPVLPEGQVVRLPTEAEWEFAARGVEGRRYPWGGDEPDKERANWGATEVNAPSPVGVFPGDVTPEGVLDLAGNVFEWCLDGYDAGSYASCHKRGTRVADPLVPAGDDETPRVLRGGAFIDWREVLRSSNRYWSQPRGRNQGIGFRCVLCAPPASTL